MADHPQEVADVAKTTGRNPYRSGRQSQGAGYVYVVRPTHPLADKHGRVLEHRLVAWDAGLLVDANDEVHHLNGDKLDNRIENLEVLSTADHAKHHAHERGFVSNGYGTYPVREHGNISKYQSGCRCAECTEANRVGCAAYWARRRAREAAHVDGAA